VARKDRSSERAGERLMFLSPEQFSELTGRPLDQVRAELEIAGEARAEDRLRRSRSLIVRPRHHADVPVQFGPPDDAYAPDAEDLARLGVSRRLIERLRTWQQGWEARISLPADPLDFTPGRPLSVRLARQLQAELPGHAIYLDANSDLRRARELSP
jgi:hypothetical protein